MLCTLGFCFATERGHSSFLKGPAFFFSLELVQRSEDDRTGGEKKSKVKNNSFVHD